MALDRTTSARDPLADALLVSHNTLQAFDALSIGRATHLELLEWIGRLSSALILLVQTVEETPVLTGQSAPEAATHAMWSADDSGPFRGPSGGTEAGR